MSNIHRIGDFQSDDNEGGGGMGNPNIPLLFQQPSSGIKPAREESFFDFLKYVCCPSMTLRSFLFWVIIVQIIFFILSLALSPKISGEFLQPDIKTLVDLGARYDYAIMQGQVFRFLTPILLHGHFMHLASNTISQLIFGTSLEATIGTKKIMIIYLISGIGGNLFSSFIDDIISVGASTGIFGIFGAHLAYFVINWDALASYGMMRWQSVIFLGMIIIFNLVMGFSTAGTVDNYGHIGGFIVGFILSFSIIDCINPTGRSESKKKYAKAIVALYFVIGFICFFTLKHPKKLF